MSKASFSKIAGQIEKEGFERGYRQAVKDMRRLVGGALDNMLKAHQEPEDGAPDVTPSDSFADILGINPETGVVTKVEAKVGGGAHPKTTKLSAEDRVFSIIKAIPGQRGAGIVTALEQTGNPVKERTVRTALWRLKNRKLIELRGNEWYVTAFAKEWHIPPKEESLPPQ